MAWVDEWVHGVQVVAAALAAAAAGGDSFDGGGGGGSRGGGASRCAMRFVSLTALAAPAMAPTKGRAKTPAANERRLAWPSCACDLMSRPVEAPFAFIEDIW